MEEKYKEQDEINMIAKGIMIGTSVGLILGFFHSNPGLTMTLGAVLGIISAEAIRMIAYFKNKNRI